MKYYTGVGGRNTPPEMCRLLTSLAKKLEKDGYILRSGGADGADKAFEAGAVHKEIYLPWEGFNGYSEGQGIVCDYRLPSYELAVTKMHYVRGNYHIPGIRNATDKLHARNVYQVLGRELDKPSKFLVCWRETDKNGDAIGGTRTAWLLAKQQGIPCFNLFIEDHMRRIFKYLMEE